MLISITAKVLRFRRLSNGEAEAGQPICAVQGAGRACQAADRRSHPHARDRATAQDVYYPAQVPAAQPDLLAHTARC